MKKKSEVTYYTNTNQLVLHKKIGRKPATAIGSLVGILVASLVYEVYRQGVGAGVQTMINAYHEGAMDEINK